MIILLVTFAVVTLCFDETPTIIEIPLNQIYIHANSATNKN